MTTLMVQGTTSDAGKSTVVAGFCRVLARRGYSVATFKPQNMALNRAVTSSGTEVHRTQPLQAVVCYLPPHVEMEKLSLDLGNATINNVVHNFTKITA